MFRFLLILRVVSFDRFVKIMKLRARLNKTTRIITIEETRSQNYTLAEIRLAVKQLFLILNDRTFQLSLNQRDFLEGEEKTLSDFDIVTGDLIFVIPDDPTDNCVPSDADLSVSSRAHDCVEGKDASNDTCGQKQSLVARDKHTFEEERKNQRLGNEQGFFETAVSGHNDTDYQNEAQSQDMVDMEMETEEVDVAVVNRYLREPMLCRDATDDQVPAILQRLYSEAGVSSQQEVVCIGIHVLMVETGYHATDQISGNHGNRDSLPADWRSLGCFKFQYTNSSCEGRSCTLTIVPMGSMMVIHGILDQTSGLQTRQLHLKWSDYCQSVNEDAAQSYCNLPKLSRLVKDTLALPLLQDLRASMELPDLYGLLALPQEVKMKLLCHLDIVSILRVAQVCKELLGLAKDPYIWRRKYLKDFGNRSNNDLPQNWYKMYKEEFVRRKEQRKALRQIRYATPQQWLPPRHNPYPPWAPPIHPGIIGGDYDLHPNFHGMNVPPPFGGGGAHGGGIPDSNLARPRIDLIGPLPGQLLMPGRGGGLRGNRGSQQFGRMGFGPRFF